MIKVCGIRSTNEASELKDLDIDFFGLIFATSKRKVDIKTAKEIVKIFKSRSKKVVGVFTNIDEFNLIKDKIEFDVYQLHGDFSFEFCKNLLKEQKEVWRVFMIKDKLPDFKEFKALFKYKNFYPLFDTKGKKMGGNGEVFNHNLIKSFPKNSFIVAGGLSEENCQEVAKLNPYVLDFNSKVETDDKKDKNKIQNIIEILRSKK